MRIIKNLKFQIGNSFGFTLVEMLVVIAILAVMGGVLTEVFVRTLRANNKSQVLSLIKQNGQNAFEEMDKAVRNSQTVLCPYTSNTPSKILVISKKSEIAPYASELFRFTYIAPTGSSNGYITQDTPSDPNFNPQSDAQCASSVGTVTNLTNNNAQTGVSVQAVNANDVPLNGVNDGPFTRIITPGSKDTVSFSFTVGPGVQSPTAVTGQIDPVEFKTIVVLR